MVTLTLKTGAICHARPLDASDGSALLAYLDGLSAESRSRFGPHPFDPETVRGICQNLPTDDVLRYVAVSPAGDIVAYLLVKKGTLPADRQRYEAAGWALNEAETCTFAPSVADAWQGNGLGNALFGFLLQELRAHAFRCLVLWGGVQASNERAVGYYTRQGFEVVGRFWHSGMDNFDMVREINQEIVT